MRIMVLSDAKTYSAAAGCRLLRVPDDWTDKDIQAALREDDNDGAIDPHAVVTLMQFGEESTTVVGDAGSDPMSGAGRSTAGRP